MIKSQEEILNVLHPCYHKLYHEVASKKSYDDERIFYAADFSCNTSGSFVEFGFIIFTDHRYLKVYVSQQSIGEIYYQSGNNSFLNRMISGEKLEKRYWVEPTGLCDYFMQKYNESKSWTGIAEQGYTDIKGINVHNYRIFDRRNNIIELIELGIEFYQRGGTWYKTFRKRDGEYVRQLISIAKQNNGRISVATTSENNDSGKGIAELINALTKLHSAGILTTPEFEAKKTELLSRL